MNEVQTEGRFFGNRLDMLKDTHDFNIEGGTWFSKEMKWVSNDGKRHVRWFACKEYNHTCQVAGMRFDKMMLDISLPDKKSIMYLLTRLRGGRIYNEV